MVEAGVKSLVAESVMKKMKRAEEWSLTKEKDHEVKLPMMVGFMLLYARLSDVLSKEALFYSIIFPFIDFFGAFRFFQYPLSSAIYPITLADRLLDVLGPSFLRPPQS